MEGQSRLKFHCRRVPGKDAPGAGVGQRVKNGSGNNPTSHKENLPSR
jgi:hypothetical protein